MLLKAHLIEIFFSNWRAPGAYLSAYSVVPTFPATNEFLRGKVLMAFTISSKTRSLAAFFAIFVAAVGLPAPTASAQSVTGILRPIRNPLVDEFDNPVPREAVDAELWSTNLDPHFQLFDREDDPITMGEWLGVSGTGQITNVPEGTALSLELAGLIPNGLYTLWGFYYDDPPYNKSEIVNFPARVAEGAVGLPDGSENEFRAAADGTAIFDAVIAPGPLSIEGEVSDWVLDGYSTFLVGATYHNDDMSYGSIPGPNAVGHFSVEFAVPEPSSVVLGLLAVVGAAGAYIRRRPASKL